MTTPAAAALPTSRIEGLGVLESIEGIAPFEGTEEFCAIAGSAALAAIEAIVRA